MFQLAHFSDPHIAPLPKARPSELANKRFLGWLSWKRRRRRVHRREILDALAADLRAQGPDHVVVTGDITNIALPAEFRQAGDWLESLGAADWISVVPGNHDAYVALPWTQGLGTWAAYMAGDGEAAGADSGSGETESGRGAFPFLRRRGPLAIVGLSTALPTPPGSAAGVLGGAQLDRLAAKLRALGEEGRFRCVLLHHPPHDNGISRRKRLIDAEGFRAVLRDAGAELVLHGHDHSFNDARLDGPRGSIPVFGVPSASARLGERRPGAHYQIYGIERAAAGWRIRILTRGLGADGHGFVEAAARSVEVTA
ncbi:MAG: metallophosphoesterase [Kiloniellales bacterium]|nr:metallophosphoesterase [Kiloniellales bacterium]